MISIIIPIYNQAEHLPNLLNSLRRQTYDNYEIIVVNDGSADDVNSVIKKYKALFGFKLTYLEEENKGASVARNYGARLAKGEYLLFCDADNILQPETLMAMRTALSDRPEAGFCYCSFIWGSKKFHLWPFDAVKLRQMPYIYIASLLRKKYFPGFDESLKRFQDWDLWLTMTEQGHGGIWLNQFLIKVSLGGHQSMSGWLPSLAYKLLPFLPAVKKYNRAKEIIVKKHKIK